MKLGLLTAAFPTLTLDEIADWAAANGFEALEVACWPAGEGAARRYAGVCHIDVAALAYYPNPLAADADARAAAQEHLRKVIAAAPLLGVDTVGTFVGRDRTRNLPDNLAAFREQWPPLVAHAAEHGVRSVGMGWQVPRLCGLGQVDWGRFVAALYAVGYENVISIEHEDRRFEGSVELVQRGFVIARNTLRPLLV